MELLQDAWLPALLRLEVLFEGVHLAVTTAQN